MASFANAVRGGKKTKTVDENGPGKKNRRQFCIWTMVLTTRETR
jgi:hypothetical protein